MERRKSKILIGLTLTIIILCTSFIIGCKSQPTTTVAPTSATSTKTPEVKTLNIGVILWLGWGLGIDSKNGIELSADLINNSGGLTIGSEKYKVNFIIYDDNNNDATARSALNRLIFEDKVKFVLCGSNFEVGLYPTIESNKVIMLGSSTQDDILSPKLHYCFRGNPSTCYGTILPAWMMRYAPEKKNWFLVCYDNQAGHANAALSEKVLKGSGATVTTMYIPVGSSDLSAMATKVKTLNPDVFMPSTGVEQDALCFKAVYQAGYRGQIFNPGAAPVGAMMAIAGPDVIQGMIKGEDPIHLDPPATQLGKDFKDAWIAKFGKWENPTLLYHINWTCLQAALEKAGSIDVEKVADVIATGLQWDSPTGSYKMIERTDLGNTRTVDLVEDVYPVKIVGSNVQLIEHLSLADSYTIYKKFNQ